MARQRETGIDLGNDGEFGHSMGQRYDFGSWWTYVFQRLAHVELTELSISEIPQAEAKPGKIILPGVVSHSTNVIEHPELVADRIVRFARRSDAAGPGDPRASRPQVLMSLSVMTLLA